MYSYEARKKAVELYIKYNKSACAVVRQLGYPTTKMLTLWYREYLVNGDLHEKSRLKKGYTADQKATAVKFYEEHGRELASTVKAIGYPCRQLLGKWVNESLCCGCVPVKRNKPAVEYTDKQKMDAIVSVAAGENWGEDIFLNSIKLREGIFPK